MIILRRNLTKAEKVHYAIELPWAAFVTFAIIGFSLKLDSMLSAGDETAKYTGIFLPLIFFSFICGLFLLRRMYSKYVYDPLMKRLTRH